MAEQYGYEPTNGATPEPIDVPSAEPSPDRHEVAYLNGNGSAGADISTNGIPTPVVVRKTLSSWVGFSNLPNQVHRRSVRYVPF